MKIRMIFPLSQAHFSGILKSWKALHGPSPKPKSVAVVKNWRMYWTCVVTHGQHQVRDQASVASLYDDTIKARRRLWRGISWITDQSCIIIKNEIPCKFFFIIQPCFSEKFWNQSLTNSRIPYWGVCSFCYIQIYNPLCSFLVFAGPNNDWSYPEEVDNRNLLPSECISW